MNDLLIALLGLLPSDAWGWIVALFQVFSAVVAVCAAIVKLVAVVSKITPSTKDDEFAQKGQLFVAKIMTVLDAMSLGLTAEQARRTGGPK